MQPKIGRTPGGFQKGFKQGSKDVWRILLQRYLQTHRKPLRLFELGLLADLALSSKPEGRDFRAQNLKMAVQVRSAFSRKRKGRVYNGIGYFEGQRTTLELESDLKPLPGRFTDFPLSHHIS